MIKKLLIGLVGLTAITNTTFTFAEQIPQPSKQDKRIKFVEYDPLNIVKLYVIKGIMTQIIFADDETIPDNKSVTYGESEQWVTLANRNTFQIKPREMARQTNLHITTNKRSYNIDVVVCEQNCQDKITYDLNFTYDKNIKNDKGRREQSIQEQKEEESKKALSFLKINEESYKNYQYVGKGDKEIKPVDIYDDGKFIYLKFSNFKSIPAIYALQDKEEVLTNSHIKNKSTVVLQQMHENLVLRTGKKVFAIHNEDFEKTPEKTTNTKSSWIERVTNNGK